MFRKIAPYVFYNPDFLGSEGLQEIRAEISTWDDWIPAHAGRYKDDKLVESHEIKDLRDVLVNRKGLSAESEGQLQIPRALDEACHLFDVGGIAASRYVVSKYSPGCHIKAHSDTDFFNTARVFTGVFYLNEEYEGGEIAFPKMGVKVKPSAGSLLLFFSEYLHAVEPIASGTRYSIVWFGVSEERSRQSAASESRHQHAM